jgi:hypothetical protein
MSRANHPEIDTPARAGSWDKTNIGYDSGWFYLKVTS